MDPAQDEEKERQQTPSVGALAVLGHQTQLQGTCMYCGAVPGPVHCNASVHLILTHMSKIGMYTVSIFSEGLESIGQ